MNVVTFIIFEKIYNFFLTQPIVLNLKGAGVQIFKKIGVWNHGSAYNT